MTTFLERWTSAPDDTEVAPMTTPRPGFPPAPAAQWWAGVYGLDPAIPVADWGLAAQCTAMACATRLFGAGAGYVQKILTRKGSPARQFTDWLLEAAGPEDAVRRRLALRLTCEQTQAADPDDVIEDARHLLASCSPGRR